MKKIEFGSLVVEFGDFTYSVSGTTVTISAKVKKVKGDLEGSFSEGGISEVATCTIGTTASSGTTYDDYTSGSGTKEDYTSGDKKGESAGTQGSSTPTYRYYQMKVSINLGGFLKIGEEQTFTMENKPTSGDKFVGTYYDGQGVKQIQIDKDGTFVVFDEGGKSILYWKDNGNGTISVKSEPFTTSSTSETGSSTTPTIYYLYPHALMSNGRVSSYK